MRCSNGPAYGKAGVHRPLTPYAHAQRQAAPRATDQQPLPDPEVRNPRFHLPAAGSGANSPQPSQGGSLFTYGAGAALPPNGGASQAAPAGLLGAPPAMGLMGAAAFQAPPRHGGALGSRPPLPGFGGRPPALPSGAGAASHAGPLKLFGKPVAAATGVMAAAGVAAPPARPSGVPFRASAAPAASDADDLRPWARSRTGSPANGAPAQTGGVAKPGALMPPALNPALIWTCCLIRGPVGETGTHFECCGVGA